MATIAFSFIKVVYINVREPRRGNQEWTIQRQRQKWAQDTANDDIQNNKTQHRKL